MRRAGRLLGGRHHAVEVGQRPGVQQVSGHLGGQQPRDVGRLEVQLPASGGRRGVVHRVAHQRVRQRQPVTRPGAPARWRRRRRDRPTKASGVEPGQRADRVERGFLPEDRGDGEDVLGRLREPGHPAADRALRGLRDHLGHGRAAGGRQPGHLGDEERVAAGAPGHGGGLVGPRRADRRSPRSGPRRRRVRGRRAARTPPPRRSRPRAGRGRTRRHLVVAPPADDQHGAGGQARQQEPQQVQASGVRPVQVVEQQHHRELGREAVEHRRARRRRAGSGWPAAGRCRRSRRRRPARPPAGRAARRARPAPAGRRSPAWRRTWVQSQNAGAPVASSAAVPRSTVAPARRARSPISVRTRSCRCPRRRAPTAGRRSHARSAATSASARSRTAASAQQHATQASEPASCDHVLVDVGEQERRQDHAGRLGQRAGRRPPRGRRTRSAGPRGRRRRRR